MEGTPSRNQKVAEPGGVEKRQGQQESQAKLCVQFTEPNGFEAGEILILIRETKYLNLRIV